MVGQLVIHNASVGPGPLSNQVIGLVKKVDAIRKQEFAQAVSSTQKVWMDVADQKIDFRMIDGRVEHRNLSVEIGDATISTQGAVHVSGQMNLLATMPIPDDWVQKSPWLSGLQGQSLSFPVNGTVSRPQIDSQALGQLGQQTIQSATNGFIQQGINKGIDKLLGGNGNTQSPDASQAESQPEANPIRGIGEQILNGQGLSIPGLFGGQNDR